MSKPFAIDQTHHTCGTALTTRHTEDANTRFCPNCHAFTRDADGEAMPRGIRKDANMKAWDDGDFRSPEMAIPQPPARANQMDMEKAVSVVRCLNMDYEDDWSYAIVDEGAPGRAYMVSFDGEGHFVGYL